MDTQPRIIFIVFYIKKLYYDSGNAEPVIKYLMLCADYTTKKKPWKPWCFHLHAQQVKDSQNLHSKERAVWRNSELLLLLPNLRFQQGKNNCTQGEFMYILCNFFLFHYFLSVINHVSHSQTCLEDISGSNYISNHSLAPVYPSVAASAISISQPVSLTSSPDTRGPLVMQFSLLLLGGGLTRLCSLKGLWFSRCLSQLLN